MLTNATIVNNDNSLLFKKLKELNALHRIIMTGVRVSSLLPKTPLTFARHR